MVIVYGSVQTDKLKDVTTTVTLKISSPELGSFSFPLQFDSSKNVVKDLGMLRMCEAIERLDELASEAEDLTGDEANKKKKEAQRTSCASLTCAMTHSLLIILVYSCFAVHFPTSVIPVISMSSSHPYHASLPHPLLITFLSELAVSMGIASADTSFWALEPKTPDDKSTTILLASVTDLDERDKPVTVLRYDIKYLMEFQPHFTDPPRTDMPWDKLPISRTAPELTSTPDKKSGGVRLHYSLLQILLYHNSSCHSLLFLISFVCCEFPRKGPFSPGQNP